MIRSRRMALRLRFAVINAAQAVFLVCFSMFWMTAATISCLVTRNNRQSLRWARTQWSPGLLWAARARLVVEGLDHVDFSRPHVFVANHQSMIDIPALYAALPTAVHFVAKKSLFSVPFLGWYMRAGGVIPVDREHSDEAKASLNAAAHRVTNGESVLAFAEGTRSRDGVIAAFKKGPFVLAQAAGVPVVPISIVGANRVLPFDGFAVRPGTIKIRIGTPIDSAAFDRTELAQRANAAVVEMNRSDGGRGNKPVVVPIGIARQRRSAPLQGSVQR